MADACTSCPDYIKFPLRNTVQVGVNRLTLVQKRTGIINDALSGTVGELSADVAAAAAVIPTPPGFSLTDVLAALTCPLTPVALALDAAVLASLDPRTLFRRLQSIIKETARTIRINYERALRELGTFRTIQTIKRYLEQLLRVGLSAVFLAEVKVITSFVSSTCPEEYVIGPYATFDTLAEDISFTGVVPSSLNADVRNICIQLQIAETKIAAWTALSVIPVPF